MLLEVFLIPKARTEYSRTLRNWLFLTGWSSLPSPILYLVNYTLIDYTKWSIIVLPIFIIQFRRDYILEHAWEAWKSIMQLDCVDDDNNEEDLRLIFYFARVMVAMAQSNNILINTRNIKLEYNRIDYYILSARYWYIKLYNVVVEAVANNLRVISNSFRYRTRLDRLPL